MQAQISDDDGKVIGIFPFEKRGKDNPFSSGSTGYHATGKMLIDEKKYQVNLLLIEIKPKKK